MIPGILPPGYMESHAGRQPAGSAQANQLALEVEQEPTEGEVIDQPELNEEESHRAYY
jgi:hypothetical protein